MPALRITTRTHDDSLVLVLEGEIDIATEGQFHQAVIAALESRPHERVVLDCDGLSFIDSSGLRVLIQAHKAAKQHDDLMVIASPTARVAQILHVTAIDSRIPVYATLGEALAAPVKAASAG